MLITRNRLVLFFTLAMLFVVLFYNLGDKDVKERKYEKISLDYSPYRSYHDITNGPRPTSEEIKQDLELISLISDHIRTYTTIGYTGTVISVANDLGITVDVGLNITNDDEQNKKEIGSLMYLIENYNNIGAVIVGNDYLHNKSADKQTIIDIISEIRYKIPPHIQISTSNPASTWWQENDELIEKVDFVTINSYPYWQGIEISKSVDSLHEEYLQTKLKLGEKNYTKPIVVGETNWPSNGKIICSAIPNAKNQFTYLLEAIKLSQQENIETFIFEAFDEEWKNDESVPEIDKYIKKCPVEHESDIQTERNWGLFNDERKLKDHLKPLIANIAGYRPQSEINGNFFSRDMMVDIDLDNDHPKSSHTLFVDLKTHSQNTYNVSLKINDKQILTSDVNLPKTLKIQLTEDLSDISLIIHDIKDDEISVDSFVLPSILGECEYEENCIEII